MFDCGELVLVPYPFTDLSSKKRRPVMVIKPPDPQGDFIAMPVTSQGYHRNSLSITGHLDKGSLPKPSWVRTDRIITLNHSLVIKNLATCRDDLVAMVIAALCEHLGSNKTEA